MSRATLSLEATVNKLREREAELDSKLDAATKALDQILSLALSIQAQRTESSE